MSLNVVVVAALALIVLIVLTAIFTGKMREVSSKQGQAQIDVESGICTDNKYYCVPKSTSCPMTESNPSTKTGDFIDCPSVSGICCGKPKNS